MQPNTSQTMQSPEFRKLLDQCIHCGLCLPACPTYAVFETEMDAPRGRIALIRGVADGRIDTYELSQGLFRQHIDRCLGCRSCETACPSGVQYGKLLEVARTTIEEQRHPSATEQAIRDIGLRQLMPKRARLRWLARLLWVAQRLGLPQLATKFSFLPAQMRTMAGILPPLDIRTPDYSRPAPAVGELRGKVAFFRGCIQDAFLAGANAATVRVLQRNGFEVHFPEAQTCCGAAGLHIGEHELALQLARQNIDAFGSDEFVAVINNAGGCGATLKEYGWLLKDDPAYAEKAQAFVEKVKDINEFLAGNLHQMPQKAITQRVVYVDSCHLRHGQKVSKQPRQLLQSIPGLQLVELKQPEMCCGSAGVYNIMQPETANQVLDAKLADVTAAHPDIIVTANTGCHMQMIYGAKKAGLKAEVLHVVELLDRAY
ncbi:MAG: heterodisulfide reductase-related iron-sulfur binding cluster [Caldilineaceae bacterium]